MSLTKTPCEAKNIHNKVFYNEKMTSSICKSEDFRIKLYILSTVQDMPLGV